MSGSTGKTTTDAVRERGPRMVLRNIYKDGRFIGQVIARLDWLEGGRWWSERVWMAPPSYSSPAIAKSYSLSYLLRIAKRNRE